MAKNFAERVTDAAQNGDRDECFAVLRECWAMGDVDGVGVMLERLATLAFGHPHVLIDAEVYKAMVIE